MKRFEDCKIILCVMFLLFFIQIVAGESSTTNNVPNWNLVGNYTWDFICTSGCTGMQLCSHYMIITSQNGGTFSGTGYTITSPSLRWIASGTVSNSVFTLNLNYIDPPPGVTTYTATFTGTISSEGKLSGTGISSANERGNLVTTSGAATVTDTIFVQNIVAEQIIVPSTDSAGVTWTAPATGTFRFTISGGAVRGGNGIGPEVCGACLDGRCYVALVNVYMNHPIIWGKISSCPVVPISPDYSLGSEPFQSVTLAEAATKGNFVDIPLNKGDQLIFAIRDYQPSYPDNSGSITIDAQYHNPDNGISTQKTNPTATMSASKTQNAQQVTRFGSQPGGTSTDNGGTMPESMMGIFYTLIIGIMLVGILFEGWKVIKNKK
jgi:hypothetical protein